MEKQQEEEEEQEQQVHHTLISLFDTLWFYNQILFHNPPPPPPSPPAPELIPIKVVQHIPNSNRRSHRRSLSDEQLRHLPSSSSTATSCSNPKLETILSGKESVLEENTTSIEIIKKTGKSKGRYRRRGSSSTKSLSDLEFEELKGFMDLGFTFSDAETDPRLMSIVPGLRRRVLACDEEKKGLVYFENHERHGCDDEEGGGGGGGGVVRPYLSEVWEVEEERRLRNWRIPAPAGGVDMKDCLRSWAQAVASTVR